MFSKTVEYALRAVVHLAQSGPDSRKTQEIAESTQVPSAYLSKVLQSLQAQGIVNMQRGAGGGVSLAHEMDALTILDIVNAVEPVQRIASCPLGLKSHGTNLCSLHHRMDKVIEQMEEEFRSTTVADLLADPNPSIPLCESKNKKKK